MIKDFQKIKISFASIISLGKKLKIFFTILFVIFCIAAFSLIVTIIYHEFTQSTKNLDLNQLFSIVSLLLEFLIYGAVIFILMTISKDLSFGVSPFTLGHAQQIKIIGILFIIEFFLNILISPGFAEIVSISNLDIGTVSEEVGKYATIPINIKSLIGAVVCFTMSVLFRYGDLLQSQSDNLV